MKSLLTDDVIARLTSFVLESITRLSDSIIARSEQTSVSPIHSLFFQHSGATMMPASLLCEKQQWLIYSPRIIQKLMLGSKVKFSFAIQPFSNKKTPYENEWKSLTVSSFTLNLCELPPWLIPFKYTLGKTENKFDQVTKFYLLFKYIPPPSAPGIHLASVIMSWCRGPATLLTTPMLRLLRNSEGHVAPNGVARRQTALPCRTEKSSCNESDLKMKQVKMLKMIK